MRLLILLAWSVASAAAVAESNPSLSDEQWAADLQQLTTAIRDIHFKPFHEVDETEFDAAVATLDAQIPSLSDADIIVRMARIVALLRDGHTRLHLPRLYPELALRAELGHSGTPPPHIDALRLGQSPLRYEWFDEGLFVVAATAEFEHLIGNEVIAFDNTPAVDALERVRSVSFFENDSRAKLMASDRLALPDVTAALGITASADRISLETVDANGNQRRTDVPTLVEAGRPFVSGAPTPAPLWLQRKDEYRWYEVLPDADAIYVQINEFEENPVTPYGDFVAETLAAAKDAGVSRYIVDLRHNFGGIGAWVTPFVTGLAASDFNEYGRLYVLTGRTTFSAAQFLLHRYEEYTWAIFAGEPSGARPSHFGDARRVVLDNSGLSLRVSTIYWHSWLANDFRDAISPHLAVPWTAADFFSGNDATLDAVLRYQPPATLALQIEEQFRKGNNQNALLLYQRYMNDTRIADRRAAIPGLLGMADRIVEDDLVRQGYFVYFMANRSYPGDPRVEQGLARLEKRLAAE